MLAVLAPEAALRWASAFSHSAGRRAWPSAAMAASRDLSARAIAACSAASACCLSLAAPALWVMLSKPSAAVLSCAAAVLVCARVSLGALLPATFWFSARVQSAGKLACPPAAAAAWRDLSARASAAAKALSASPRAAAAIGPALCARSS
jgi:uncharacterized membrane protein